jgi:drug/metabolite transporter (DMT)-like permease
VPALVADARTHRVHGLLLGALGSIAFSAKAIIVKLAYRHGVDAVTLLMYRMLFSLPLFLALAWWSGRNKPALSARDWAVLSGLGASGYYVASYLDFLGLQYVNASLERLILYLSPTIVLAIAHFFHGTRVSGRQWAALSISYAGVLVVFGHDLRLGGADAALGSVLVFGSAVSYALYLVYSGEAVARYGSARLVGVAMSVACGLCIGQFFLLRPVSAMGVVPEVLWLSVLNAVLCTFIPVLLVMMAIRRVGAAATAQMSLIGPLSTIFLAVLILDEPFTVWVAAGTALVLAGIALLARWRA